MGGGGGGGISYGKMKQDLDAIKAKADQSAFKGQLADNLQSLLSSFDPGTNENKERIDELVKAIKADIEGNITLRYGGSVKKHTYVDGLSDVDVLLILNDSELENSGPEKARERLKELIAKRYGEEKEIEIGTLAVTVSYPDGTQIQLLPAIRTQNGVRIPNSTGNRWSEINPEGFTDALSRANANNGNKLIPVIKLIKAINANLPEQSQLTGYHIESLAIEAFKGYSGERTHTAMLDYFYSRATEIVKKPLKDKTKQSLHVDEYLGAVNSEERKIASNVLDRIVRRIRFATISQDLGAFMGLFE